MSEFDPRGTRISGDGVINLRFIKDDGGYHRVSIQPGDDVDQVMAAVNAHLRAMGQNAVADVVSAKRLVAERHTPEAIQKFRARNVR